MDSAAGAERFLVSSDQTPLGIPRSENGAENARIADGVWRWGCSLEEREAPAPCVLAAFAGRFLTSSEQTPLGVPRSEDGAEGAVSQMTTCNHGCRKTFPPLLVSPKLTIHRHGATGLQSGRSLGSHATRIGNSCRSLSHIVIPDTAEGTEEQG